jgi:AcrR family transcriptional regulator
VSPRGVAIHEAREQLFLAAERVLAREGPDGLTSRAITQEAGVANGLLFNHFGDLDGFLVQLILDRARRTAGQAWRLVPRAGTATVTGNLADAAAAVLQSGAFATAALVLSRPSLMARLQQQAAGAPTPLDDIQTAFAAYLDAEQKLGRIAASADTETLALTLTGTLHHIFLTRQQGTPDPAEQARRVAAALITPAAANS